MNLTVTGGKGIIIPGTSLAIDGEGQGLAWFCLLTVVSKKDILKESTWASIIGGVSLLTCNQWKVLL